MAEITAPGKVSNFFLDKVLKENESIEISNLKLIKLVYIAYGWFFYFIDKKLFTEKIEAWEHGPVIPSIYHSFKHFGFSQITDYFYDYKVNENIGYLTEEFKPSIDYNNENLVKVLKWVWGVYKNLTAIELRNMTHQEGTPWHLAYSKGRKFIDDKSIKEYFKNRAKELGIE